MPDPETRFLSRVKRGPGCWEWTGAKHGQGYGRFSAEGELVLAHRFAYELFVGPIPEGLTIDHLCRNRNCVNPDHLEPVTHRENTLRGEGITARQARQTHCLRGHELNRENTYLTPDGRRQCRACLRLRHHLRKEAQLCLH